MRAGVDGIAGEILDVREMFSQDAQPVPWAVEGLVIEQAIGLISGKGGIGKSYVLVELAMALASGKPLFGHFPVARPYKVLYIDQEMAGFATENRFRRMLKGAGFSNETVPADNLIVMTKGCLTLDNEAYTQNLVEFVKEQGVEFVLVDSLARTLRGSENDADTINRFFRSVKPLRDKCKAGLILLAHHRKKNVDDSMNTSDELIRGSSAIRDIVDFHIAMNKRGCMENYMTVEPDKDRHGDAAIPPFKIFFDHDDPTDEAGAFRLSYDDTGFDNHNQKKLYDLIPSTSVVTANELVPVMAPVARTLVYRYLKLFEARGLVTAVKQGKIKYYTRVEQPSVHRPESGVDEPSSEDGSKSDKTLN